MEGGPLVSIVLPTYNERESLAQFDPELQRALTGLSSEIVVVDDGSPDGTAEFARSLPGPVPHTVVDRGAKRGLASAVLDGFRASRGDILLVMDADGSHPPSVIPEMVALVRDRGYEFVLGSRWIAGGSSEGFDGGRRLMSIGAAALARPLVRVSDPMSGFFATRRSVAERAPLVPRGFKIGLEILVRARPSPIAEVPIEFRPRLAGESKLGRGEIRQYLAHLGRLYVARLEGPRRASTTR